MSRPGALSVTSRATSRESGAIEMSVSGSDSRHSQDGESIRRWGSLESAMLAVRTLAQDAEDVPQGRQERGNEWLWSLRFLVVSFAVIANNALRAWCIYFFALREKFAAVIWQLFFELVGFLLSLHITKRDPDVQRRLRSGTWLARTAFAFFALVVLGLFQVIHVKRAWARQLRNAEVLESLEDQDYMWTTPVLGAERGLPVAIVTNIPAVPLFLYAFLLKRCFGTTFWSIEPSSQHSLLWWCEPKSMLETYILGFSIISQMMVISICVVDLDIATSAFVARRYDMSRSGLRGKLPMQVLYPAFHILFRIFEVVSRIIVLCSFLAVCAFYCGLLGVLTTACVCVLDLVVLLMILQRYSPGDEAICVHLVVAGAMLVTDAARFVDRPGFCYPANCISKAAERWRWLHVLLLASIVVTLELTIGSNPERQLPQFIRATALAVTLGISLFISQALKLTIMKARGDDLHTAMLNHKIPRVRKLLEFSLGGEVLDVNGPTKDSERVTASMLAAKSGFVEGLRMIMACGGKVEVRNSQGETCIHFAVRHLQLEALEFLVNQPGANQVLRSCRKELLKLAVEACGARIPQDGIISDNLDFLALVRENQRLKGDDTRQLFLLLEPERGTRRNAEEVSAASSLENVRAHLAISRHLLRLFPNADEEHAPELHDLHSVSALLVAHGTGTLARLLLRSPRAVGLEQLRRIRTLGQGASGTVIEVEYEAPMPNGSTLRMRLNSAMAEPKRFAMKLQSKRNMHMDWQAYSEVVALRRCGHPFIVRLEQAFQTPHYYALLLELCPNGDVNQLLCKADERGRYPGLPLERAAKFAGQILLALVHLHEEYGIIYRDVKPKNVLLSAYDEAKLADFGLALYVGRKFFAENDMPLAGTPSFWAPELILGEEGPDPVQEVAFDPFKTDAYSFGVTLLLMLLGEDCADLQVDDDDCMWMIPRSWQNDDQRGVELARQVECGRLCSEALDLLEKLIILRQSKRSRLANPEIRQHAFFLNALNCQDLHAHLLGDVSRRASAGPPQPSPGGRRPQWS